MSFFRDRKKLFGLAVLLCAVITIIVAFVMVSDNTQEEMMAIYTAAADITRGEQLTEDNITTIAVPVAEAEGYATDASKIIGKVAASHIWMGDRISENKLVDQLNDVSPEEGFNFISMSIPSIDAGVAGFIKPGDFISIMCYGEREVPVEETEESDDALVDEENEIDDELVDEYYPYEDDYEDEPEIEYEITSFIPHELEAVEIIDLRDNTNISTEEALGDDVPSTVTLNVTTEQALVLYQAMNEYNIHFIRVGGEEITPSYEILAQEALEAELAELAEQMSNVVPAA